MIYGKLATTSCVRQPIQLFARYAKLLEKVLLCCAWLTRRMYRQLTRRLTGGMAQLTVWLITRLNWRPTWWLRCWLTTRRNTGWATGTILGWQNGLLDCALGWKLGCTDPMDAVMAAKMVLCLSDHTRQMYRRPTRKLTAASSAQRKVFQMAGCLETSMAAKSVGQRVVQKANN
jgi:hypothetical protein